MPTAKLKVIAEAKLGSRTLLANKNQPLVVGGGDWDYLCGSCGIVIGARVAQYLPFIGRDGEAMLVACNECGSFNELPTRPAN